MRLLKHGAAVGLVVCGLIAGCQGDPAPAPNSPPTGTTVTTSAPPSSAPPEQGLGQYDAGRSTPVADPLYKEYGNPALDVLHYGLDLTWVPGRSQLSGTATLTIRAVKPVREIALDFARTFTVSDATVDGAKAATKWRGNDIVVALTQPLAADAHTTVVLKYRGTPRRITSQYFAGWSGDGMGMTTAPGGEAWTMQQPFGAFTWYPVNDHPSDEALYDFAVTVPKGWTGVATGQLTAAQPRGSQTTYRWHTADPVASYSTTLAVGRYTRMAMRGPGGVPVTAWLRTGKDEALRPLLRQMPGLLSWLAARFGPYPFPAAGLVVVDSSSVMETQQMLTWGGGISPGANKVLLHELSHEWFGNSVTPRDWRSIWLSEGLATWIEAEWLIDRHGASRQAIVDSWRATDGGARASGGPPGRLKANHFGEQNVYASPALLFHEIRRAVGAKAFASLLRDWVQTQRNQPVDRRTFTDFVNRHTGRNLTALINTWLDAGTTPKST